MSNATYLKNTVNATNPAREKKKKNCKIKAGHYCLNVSIFLLRDGI